MGKTVYKSREQFLGSYEARRVRAVERRKGREQTEEERELVERLDTCRQQAELKDAVADFRASVEFGEREKIICLVEDWVAANLGPMFKGGKALQQLFDGLRDGDS